MFKYNIGDILKFDSKVFADVHEYGMIMQICGNAYSIKFFNSVQEHQYYIDYVDGSKHISMAA